MMEGIICFLEWQGALPLVLFLSVIIAIIAIFYARKNVRQQNSIELILSLQKESKFWESMTSIQAQRNHITQGDLHKIGELIGNSSNLENEKDEMRKKVENFRYIMNVFENVSVGIQYGIYDDSILKEMFRTSFVMTWNCSKPVVIKIREIRQKNTYYEIYEKVAKRWQKGND